ncbi:MAG: rod shape-determining protein MreC [Deltaproteobacteria bacterium]|nr:rod shape-determining protein MreC [Deltaproteobacteria bacterium]MBW2417633.1 rod shape-determining protein MreC [Deltaproteobacteria bacterium]
MPEFLKRLRALIAFAVLALVATITMLGDRPGSGGAVRDLPWWQGLVLEITAPVQKLAAAPIDAVLELWDGYMDLLDVRDSNQRLALRVAELEEESLQYREALVASGHLQRIAAMRDEFEMPMLPTEVVGLDVSPWFRSILMDRGRSHGVHAGNPVVTHEGVVGLVTAVSAHAAKTMLLLDRQSAIDGIVQRSRDRGIARGRGSGELEFEFVVRGGDVQSGDVVITSGLGGVYPKGLRIGEVVELSDPAGQLMQVATLRPAVDFGRLEQVFVMLHRGHTMELLYADDLPADRSFSEPIAAPIAAPEEAGEGEAPKPAESAESDSRPS